MPNVVETKFTVDAREAFRTADDLEKRYEKVDKALSSPTKLGGGSSTGQKTAFPVAQANEFSKSLSAAERKAHDLHYNLNQLSTVALNTRGFEGLGAAAARTSTAVSIINTRLKEIQAASGRTSSPALLKGLQAEASRLNLELDNINRKFERVTAGRAAAASRQATGLGKYGGLAQQAAGILPAEAQQALSILEAAKAAGIVTSGSLILFGGLAVAGAVIVKYFISAREEAERRLKIEEAIQGSINKQILSAKALNAAFSTRLKDEQDDRVQARFLKSATTKDLEDRLAALTKLRALGGTFERNEQGELVQSKSSGRTEASISSVRAALVESRSGGMDRARRDLEDHNEAWKRSQEDQRRAAERFQESVKGGIEKAKQLRVEFKGAFNELLRAGNSNPMVTVFLDADEAMTKLRENTKGLPADLRRSFEDMQRTVSATKLFEARISGALEAGDLRQTASRFRGTGVRDVARETDESYAQRISRGFNTFNNTNAFGVGARDDITGRNQIRAYAMAMATDALGNSSFGGGFNRQSVAFGAFQAAKQREEQNLSAQDRINRQFAAIDQFKPENQEQRDVAERKILSIAGTLEPDSLNAQTRDRIATAAENQAVRVEQREAETLRVAKDNLLVNQRIEESFKSFLGVAQAKGIQGVNAAVAIEVKDSTANGIQTRRPPTSASQADVTSTFFDQANR